VQDAKTVEEVLEPTIAITTSGVRTLAQSIRLSPEGSEAEALYRNRN
jgi:hypothetical protein